MINQNNQQGIYEDLDGCDQPAGEEEELYAQLREYGEIQHSRIKHPYESVIYFDVVTWTVL